MRPARYLRSVSPFKEMADSKYRGVASLNIPELHISNLRAADRSVDKTKRSDSRAHITGLCLNTKMRINLHYACNSAAYCMWAGAASNDVYV